MRKSILTDDPLSESYIQIESFFQTGLLNGCTEKYIFADGLLKGPPRNLSYLIFPSLALQIFSSHPLLSLCPYYLLLISSPLSPPHTPISLSLPGVRQRALHASKAARGDGGPPSPISGGGEHAVVDLAWAAGFKGGEGRAAVGRWARGGRRVVRAVPRVDPVAAAIPRPDRAVAGGAWQRWEEEHGSGGGGARR